MTFFMLDDDVTLCRVTDEGVAVQRADHTWVRAPEAVAFDVLMGEGCYAVQVAEAKDAGLVTEWKTALRRVRTPEGARAFGQAIGTVIKPDIGGGGGGAQRVTAADAERIFSGAFGEDGFRPRIEDIAEDEDGNVTVLGRIDSRDFGEVGHFTRTFSPSDRTVTHQSMELDTDYRGLGFAREFNAHAEREYARLGYRRIVLEAGSEDGGRVWAKAGYQWLNGEPPGEMSDAVKDPRSYLPPGSLKNRGWTEEERAAMDALVERFDAGNPPTPAEVAAFGPGMVNGRNTLGEAILMAVGWYGEKEVDPGVEKARRAVTMFLEVRGLREEVEEKAVRLRYVRTAEGAAKYGQPIGSLIRADVKLTPELEDAYALLDKDTAYRIQKRKAAVKFYAQRRDGLSVEEAQAKAELYEMEAVAAELLLTEPAPAKVEPAFPTAIVHSGSAAHAGWAAGHGHLPRMPEPGERFTVVQASDEKTPLSGTWTYDPFWQTDQTSVNLQGEPIPGRRASWPHKITGETRIRLAADDGRVIDVDVRVDAAEDDLDAWLEGSVLKDDVFHVTTTEAAAAIREGGFEVRKGKSVPQFGAALYFSGDKTDAHMPYGGGERLTAKVKLKRPLKLTMGQKKSTDGNSVLRLAAAAGLKLGPKNQAVLDAENKKGNAKAPFGSYAQESRDIRENMRMDRDEFVASVKKQGYDGLIVDGTKSGRQIVVYDADRVRVVDDAAAAPLPDLAPARLRELFGENLTVLDRSDVSVRHLAALDRLPEAHLKAVADAGVKIVVGDTGVGEMPGMEKHKDTRPRGWSGGTTWKSVSGVYLSEKKVLLLGRGKGDSENLAAHEFAHALDDTLSVGPKVRSHEPAFEALWKRTVKTGGTKIDSYYRKHQIEFFAEAYASWSNPGKKYQWTRVMGSYDPDPELVQDLEAYFDGLVDRKKNEATPFEKPAPKGKAKKVKPWTAQHPSSGRVEAVFRDPTQRGTSGGPLLGYNVGEVVSVWDWGKFSSFELVGAEVVEDTDEIWTSAGGGKNTGRVRKVWKVDAVRLEADGSRRQRDAYETIPDPDRPGKTKRVKTDRKEDAVEKIDLRDAVPLLTDPTRLDPDFTLEPSLEAVDAAELPLEALLPEDALEGVRRAFARKAVQLDTAGDSYSGKLTPELVALRLAKEDGLRTLGRAFGFTDEETDEAIEDLEKKLNSWAQMGTMAQYRYDMHQAVKKLRDGAAPETPTERGMLLQRAWSNATFDRRHGRDAEVEVGRFIQDWHAVTTEAYKKLTTHVVVPDVTENGYPSKTSVDGPLAPEAVELDVWTLTSWSVTPGGVQKGFIGFDRPAVKLSTKVERDSVWLNVWGESVFRTHGLKAPGEFILDDSKPLNFTNTEVEPYHPNTSSLSGRDDNQARLSQALAEQVLRRPDLRPEHAAAGAELMVASKHFQRLVDVEVAEEFGAPEPSRTRTVYRHKVTGELYPKSDQYGMGPSTKDPDYDDYERRVEVWVDPEATARFDALTDLAQERGWSQTGVTRARQHFNEVGEYGRKLALLKMGRRVYHDYLAAPKTQADLEKNQAHLEAMLDVEVPRALAALKVLGVELTEAELIAYVEGMMDQKFIDEQTVPFTLEDAS